MSGKTGTMTSCVLGEAKSDLEWLLKTTEQAVSTLVTAFGGLTRNTDAVSSLASAIVDCVEDEGVGSVLASVHDLGAVAKQFVGDRLQATSGILETVTTETDLLRQLAEMTESQAKIALEIKILNVHTKIEVAHLGSVGTGFEYLARELADFSRSLARSTDELTSHTSEHKAANEKTQSMLSVELPRLRDELARVETRLSDGLDVMSAGLSKLSRTPALFKQSAEEIAQQVVGVVVAVQGHDITRQQLEHVEEALAIISGKLPSNDDAEHIADSDVACGHAGLTIQIAQLGMIKATFAEWAAQIETCMDSILRISASELVGVGPLVLEQEQSMSSQLSHIDSLERECQSYGESLSSTLCGISHLSELVTEHIQKSETARNRLRLLTFNSVVEASRLGAKADAICVIADGIAEVSVQWSKISEQSRGALQEILNLADRINEVTATFSEANSARLRDAQAQTKRGLENLRRAAAFALAQGKKIEAVTDEMRTRSEEIGQASQLLESCFGRIDKVVSALEKMKIAMEADHPDVKQGYDEVEIERVFATSYTTQTEREVLRAALNGTEYSAAQQCSMGNSVELF